MKNRRRITPTRAQCALDALMVLVQTSDWKDVDADDRQAIHRTCEVLTRLRDREVLARLRDNLPTM
jgi:hypothetical protein